MDYLDTRPIGRELAKDEKPCDRCEVRSAGFMAPRESYRVCVCGKQAPAPIEPAGRSRREG